MRYPTRDAARTPDSDRAHTSERMGGSYESGYNVSSPEWTVETSPQVIRATSVVDEQMKLLTRENRWSRLSRYRRYRIYYGRHKSRSRGTHSVQLHFFRLYRCLNSHSYSNRSTVARGKASLDLPTQIPPLLQIVLPVQIPSSQPTIPLGLVFPLQLLLDLNPSSSGGPRNLRKLEIRGRVVRTEKRGRAKRFW